MRRYLITPNQLRVADFLSWQKDGSLSLKPPFQRRAVWKPGARSYFVDTIVKGLPVPLVFIRERVELSSKRVIREVVDGQQRLRTLFAFIDETSLPDFRSDRDRFFVRRTHNPDLAGKRFDQLDDEIQSHILEYRFSVQTLPRDVEDREILQIFARMNSTGVKLNGQELRNAEWFGDFKTLMYELAYQQLERWREWKIFSEDQIARMAEVELVSDLIMSMLRGLSAKSQPAIGSLYSEYDESFPGAKEAERRFQRVMDAIEELYGQQLNGSIFEQQMHFFTLFAYLYHRMYGLGSPLAKRSPRQIPTSLAKKLDEVDLRFQKQRLPRAVLESVTGAATDLKRRRSRFEFYESICGKASG